MCPSFVARKPPNNAVRELKLQIMPLLNRQLSSAHSVKGAAPSLAVGAETGREAAVQLSYDLTLEIL